MNSTNDAHGPLAGVRVLEMAGQGPGPFCGMLLADLGAEVVVVERPTSPTLVTLPNPVIDRGRRSVVVDLKRNDAAEVVLRLVARSDLFIEGLRPGVMERLGIGPQPCLERNPRLVYGRLTGWGQTGPWVTKAGHDINYIGLTGALHAIGPAERPVPPLNLVGDYGGGSLYLALGLVAGLVEARTSGRGQVVDAAMLDGAASLMSMAFGQRSVGRWRDARQANLLDGGCPFYDTYRCADGGFVAVGAIEDAFFAELVKGLGLDPESQFVRRRLDPESWPALRSALEATFATRARDAWCELFDDTDACVTPVLSMTEAAAHPQNAARNVLVDTGATTRPGPAPRFSRTQGTPSDDVAVKGADTTDLLRDSGWSADEIQRLRADGVVS
jgi:alpha-methylacyl-CoA racemase